MSSAAVCAPPLWRPSDDQIADATLTRFTEFVRTTRGVDAADYHQLWQWSVTDLDGFWSAVWEFFGLHTVSGYDRVLAEDTMPHTQWFPGARINFAQAVLDAGDADTVAVLGVDETGATTELTRTELRRQVGALAVTLAEAGVRAGDVVAGYLPNIPEAVVAFLATASLGATWSAVGQDLAAAAVIDRFTQLEPKVLVTADGYRFAGRVHPRLDAIAAIEDALPTLARVIVADRFDTTTDPRHTTRGWQGFTDAIAPDAQIAPVAVPFEHPLWVVFSSGTTGTPKGLVHGHGGILLETLKQVGLHWDLRPTDRVFWYTSPSWVMWNMQLSTLALGGSIVCYDGSPTHPDPARLWQLAADLHVSFLGVSPGYLQACANTDLAPASRFDLSALRAIGATGAPLSPQLHRWALEHVGELPLWSISGGTDIAGAFVGGAPTAPVWAGKISVRCLGAAVEAWDEHGQPVTDEVGDLVVTRPMPSMPVSLWNDPETTRYRDTYLSTYPGVWRHGDWITIDPGGAVVIHGRSDSTLNRNGIRMGSADIYAAVEPLDEIAEALVLGVEPPDGSYWMPLFVTLTDGRDLDPALRRPHPRRDPRHRLTPPRPRPDHRGPRDPAHPHRQETRGPPQTPVPGRRPARCRRPRRRRRPDRPHPVRRPRGAATERPRGNVALSLRRLPRETLPHNTSQSFGHQIEAENTP